MGGSVYDVFLWITPKNVDVEIYGLAPDSLKRILAKKFKIEIVGKGLGEWILKE